MASDREVAETFVRLINAGDVDGIIRAVTADSSFFVEGETPTVGRDRLREAWVGYFAAYPSYQIYVDESHEQDDATYLLGHTAGSHVPEELESVPSSVIWRCEVGEELVAEWSVYPESAAARRRFGLCSAPTA